MFPNVIFLKWFPVIVRHAHRNWHHPLKGVGLRDSGIHFQWLKNPAGSFSTGVSLHSHTLHSKESLDFIQRVTKDTPWLGGAIRKQTDRYRAINGRDIDFSKAWWTPPLAARHAWELEKGQIEGVLGLKGLVSLTDHDTIDACLHLHVLEGMRDVPVSVEWTIPYAPTFFHIGVHNLPAEDAPAMMREMEAFTDNPVEAKIGEMLEWVSRDARTLVIINHPCWDENHIGAEEHRATVIRFLDNYRPFIHAAELNGLRPWDENQKAADLAARYKLPVISGGDRHGREPNANVNLTNATTFSEFVDEVRSDAHSEVLFMSQYRDPLKMRILENMADIIEDDPRHAMGWVKWSDRVFWENPDGEVKSVGEHWGNKVPRVVNRFVNLMSLVKHRRVRSVLRVALEENRQFAV